MESEGLVARWKPKSFWGVVRVLWVTGGVMTLLLTLVYRSPRYPDSVEAEALIMMGLAFPSGWVVGYECFGTLIGGNKTSELAWIFITWVPLFLVGYLQWFVLIPFIARWVQRSLLGGGRRS